MILLNKSHPKFLMEMEVACLIPKLPLRVDMKDICSDLQITRESLNSHLTAISNRHRVTFTPGNDDMAVGVPVLSWPRLDAEATAYYESVYGKDND